MKDRSWANVVLFISIGILVFIIIFCFAKRQISRFALKSSKIPHETIGHHAPKALLLEIERRLRRVKDICIEPQLITEDKQEELKMNAKMNPYHHYYRMQALDNVSLLYDEIKKCNVGATKKVGVPLRVFLFEQRQVGCLEGIRLEVIEKLCSSYDHARHDPKVFTKNDLKEFQGILKLLLHYIHNKQKQYLRQQSDFQHTNHQVRTTKNTPTGKRNPFKNLKSPFHNITRSFSQKFRNQSPVEMTIQNQEQMNSKSCGSIADCSHRDLADNVDLTPSCPDAICDLPPDQPSNNNNNPYSDFEIHFSDDKSLIKRNKKNYTGFYNMNKPKEDQPNKNIFHNYLKLSDGEMSDITIKNAGNKLYFNNDVFE